MTKKDAISKTEVPIDKKTLERIKRQLEKRK